MLEAWLAYKRLAPLIGLAVVPLLILLAIQKGETRHWHKSSDRFEQLYHGEQAAFAGTVANYRAAADAARAADKANTERAAAEQRAINERTAHDYEARIADARARAAASLGRVRQQAAGAAHPGGGGSAPVPGLPSAAGGTDQAAGQDRLPPSDALTATEQAIQLDELVKWVTRQNAVDPNAKPPH